MSPETPTRAPAGLEDALARVLDPMFDAAFYLAANPDVAQAGMEPYLHFIEHGLAEGRDPHPLVRLAYVRERLGMADEPLDPAALVSALSDPAIGGHPAFDGAAYLEDNPDVREAGLPALLHYVLHGAEEGRRPRPDFDPDWYRERYLGPDAGRYAAFVHYATAGAACGNAPCADAEAGARSEAPLPPVADADAAADEPAAVEGFFDAVHGRTAHGWAWAPAHPERRPVIEIIADGHVVGRGRADVFREDLEAHGFGDGRHAFRVRLSRDLDDGGVHRLQARVADSGTGLAGDVAYQGDAAPAGDYDPVDGRQAEAAARAIVRGLADADGAAFAALAREARLLVETAEHDAALVAIAAAEERFPGTALLALLAADACLGLGQPEKAVAHCQRAVEAAGDGELAAAAQLALGNARRLLGQWTEAEAAYSRALARDPHLAAAHRRLAQAGDRRRLIEARRCLAEGDAAGALERLVPQLVRRPDDEALQRLVQVALARQRGGEAPAGLEPDTVRAVEAVRLLGAVVDHARSRGFAA